MDTSKAGHVTDNQTVPTQRHVKRSPAQLEKKRAADREAQRVTRERTKARIESLERLVQTLQNTQHSPACTSALRERDEARVELADLRARLGPIVRSLQSVATPSVTPPNHDVDVSSDVQDTPNSTTSKYCRLDTLKYSITIPASGTGYLAGLPTGTPGSSISNSQNWASPHSPAGNTFSPQYDGRVGNGPSPIEVVKPVDVDLSKQFLQESIRGTQEWASQGGRHANGHGPTWSLPLNNVLATCPLDSILLTFIDSRRRMIQQGATEYMAVGPPHPDFATLLGWRKDQEMCSVSQVIADIIAKMEAVNSLPEKTAVFYIIVLLIRWQISPTLDNYDRLPVWLQPLPSQYHCPHPAWIDYVPWPAMRNVLTLNHSMYPQDDMLVPWTQTLRINWSYDADKVLLVHNKTKEVSLNPVFEQHLRRLPNWTLGLSFSHIFPSLKGTYRMVDPAETGKEAGWEYTAG